MSYVYYIEKKHTLHVVPCLVCAVPQPSGLVASALLGSISNGYLRKL